MSEWVSECVCEWREKTTGHICVHRLDSHALQLVTHRGRGCMKWDGMAEVATNGTCFAIQTRPCMSTLVEVCFAGIDLVSAFQQVS